MSSATPCVFIPHGGGPLPILGDKGHEGIVKWLKDFEQKCLSHYPSPSPKAIIVFSAHWEESVPTILSSPQPPLYYDYYNFPPESYSLKYPITNDLELVHKVGDLLKHHGIEYKEDPKRGYDHGVFIPLMLMFPKPEIPIVQVSLIKGLDPLKHYKLGQALSSLRKEGVLMIGSGMSYHGSFGPGANDYSEKFHEYLNQALLRDNAEERLDKILNWKNGPDAKKCHPREEHLIPLMVLLGASNNAENIEESFSGKIMNVRSSAYIFN